MGSTLGVAKLPVETSPVAAGAAARNCAERVPNSSTAHGRANRLALPMIGMSIPSS